MVRVAICDDEKEIITELELTLADIFGVFDITHEISSFLSVNELCGALKGGTCYDLIFLDIGFSENEINGVEMGWLIREILHDNTVSIVYISWEERYALQLFKIRPLDFLIKPLTREKVKKTIETYIRITAPLAGGGEFTYKRGRATHSAQIKDIVYLEANDRKVIVHFRDGGTDDFYGTLKDVYEKQLKECDFLFAHASFLVNYDYVTATGYRLLHVTGGLTLPISQSRRNEVRYRCTAIAKRRLA